MQTSPLSKRIFFLESPRNYLFLVSSIAITLGFVLSIISWLNLCTEICGAVHNYRLYGLKFETVGFVFFPLLLFFHFFSLSSTKFSLIAGSLLAGAFGAEMLFVLAQKYIIGHWCPVCLGIAACIALAAVAYMADSIIVLKLKKADRRSEIMRIVSKGVLTSIIVLCGFLIAYMGIGKTNVLEGAEKTIKDSVVFGNAKSTVEAYLFTDWACPACRELEPKLKEVVPVIEQNARLTFVDFVIHPETLNYMPYNLSFMINNKTHYLDIRDALTSLSIKTGTPKDEEVEAAAKSLGLNYKQLNYADVQLGTKYFKHLGDEFDIDTTPTLVLVNMTTKKGKKLYGAAEITPTNVKSAIEILKGDK